MCESEKESVSASMPDSENTQHATISALSAAKANVNISDCVNNNGTHF